jgi:lysozyme family protein
MSASSFDAAIARVLAHEGGYTDHPSDPGGPTNFGITIYDARRYLNQKLSSAPPWRDADRDVMRAVTREQAIAIYRAKYWDALSCDALPAGVDYAVFDYGVNSGIGRAAKVLQRVVYVADEGAIGPVTLFAAARGAPGVLIISICDERLRFLRSLRTWSVFGKGWARRVADVKDAALAMAAEQGG